eukprot:CAMPEP_0197056046 /NCGR_PEP_ID=MMETSP1384-20130603/77862_1 /TAXON_ID=29189 /ORGANISM="Ammonia sp." /LENGTH=72 /DNA_ID=CAMNT_0042489873 /DNA_START=145 /DNA_END=363 /DNA_ORIENTATION=-
MFTIGALAISFSGDTANIILLWVLALVFDVLAVFFMWALCWGDAHDYREGVQYPDMQRPTGIGGVINSLFGV